MTRRRNRKWGQAAALLLALGLLCTACGGSTSMRLVKTEGTVGIQDGDGKDIAARQKLKLYSGYSLTTARRSYAWINLDNVKLTKMDVSSEIEIRQKGKGLDIQVNAGKLYFNVTEPLGDDESMDIRTATMAIGIRGTCGWVEVADERHMSIYLLEGKVEGKVKDPDSGKSETVTVSAGEKARMSLSSSGEVQINVEKLTEKEVIPFVLEELRQDEELRDKILEDSGLDISRLPGIGGPGSAVSQAAAEVDKIMGVGAADSKLASRVNQTVRQENGQKISLYVDPFKLDKDAAIATQNSLVDGMLNGTDQKLPQIFKDALEPGGVQEDLLTDYMQIRMGSGINCYKPNIYLYGEEGTLLSLSFAEPALLTKTLPEYVGIWEVEIGAEGKLTVDGEEGYPFLFYESITIPGIFQKEAGFLLKARDRAAQMREILEAYGLNGQEISDFLEFWDEMLDADKDYLMYPQDTELVDGAMPVVMDGAPVDHYFRLWFCFEQAGEGAAAPKRPVIVPASHEGTALVEWGGMILP